MREKLRWRSKWQITEFNDPTGEVAAESKAGLSLIGLKQRFPVERESIIEGNLALNEGIQGILDLIAGLATPTLWNEANSYFGVGDDATAAAAAQTGLLAAVNKEYNAVDAGYPTRSSQTVTWRGTFGNGEAEFDWNEFTVANGNSNAAVNLNRKVYAYGTKAVGKTWVISLALTLS